MAEPSSPSLNNAAVSGIASRLASGALPSFFMQKKLLNFAASPSVTTVLLVAAVGCVLPAGMRSEDCTQAVSNQPLAEQVAACESALASAEGSAALDHQLSLATLALQQRDYPRVEQYLVLAKAAPSFASEPSAQYRYYRLQGLQHWYQKQLDRAEALLQQAHQVAVAMEDSALLAKSLNELGVIQNARGNHKDALRYLQQSLALKQALRDDYGSAITLSNIGLAHLKMEAYADAEGFYQEALQAYGRYTASHPDDRKALQSLAHLYEDLTLLYSLHKKPSQSASYAAQLTALYDQLLSAEEQTRVLATLATAQMNAGRWPAAGELLARVRNLLADHTDIKQPAAMLALARLAQQQQALTDASTLAERARQLAREQSLPDQETAALQLLAEIAQTANQPQQALTHYQDYMAAREQLLAARYDQTLGALRQDIVREQLQRKLAEKSALSERQSADIHRLTIGVLASLLLLAVTTFGALTYFYRKRREHQELLRQIASHRQQLVLLQQDPVDADGEPAERDDTHDATVATPQSTEANAADQQAFNRLLVEAMLACVALWEKATQTNRVELADRSKIWKVSIDDGRLRTRSLDKYLSLEKLPRQPRWRSVVQTCHYVLAECQLSSDERAQLNAQLNAIMAAVKAKALLPAPVAPDEATESSAKQNLA